MREVYKRKGKMIVKEKTLNDIGWILQFGENYDDFEKVYQ